MLDHWCFKWWNFSCHVIKSKSSVNKNWPITECCHCHSKHWLWTLKQINLAFLSVRLESSPVSWLDIGLGMYDPGSEWIRKLMSSYWAIVSRVVKREILMTWCILKRGAFPLLRCEKSPIAYFQELGYSEIPLRNHYLSEAIIIFLLWIIHLIVLQAGPKAMTMPNSWLRYSYSIFRRVTYKRQAWIRRFRFSIMRQTWGPNGSHSRYNHCLANGRILRGIVILLRSSSTIGKFKSDVRNF